jgi:hypothetical protein
MAFKEYYYGTNKQKVKDALRKRLALRERVRYHTKKIEHHEKQRAEIEQKKLPEVEKQIDNLLGRG